MNNPRRPFTEHDTLGLISGRALANKFNDLFEKMLDESLLVYLKTVAGQFHCGSQLMPTDTHTAKLLCIEPIVKKECTEHEPSFTEGGFWREGKDPVRCAHCDIKLKTKWVGVE